MTNVFHTLIARFLQIPEGQVERTIGLLNEGATIPFISRYRKEVTGGLDEVQIGAIKDQLDKLTELSKRKETILATIEEQEKLTPELRKRIEESWDSTEIEDAFAFFFCHSYISLTNRNGSPRRRSHAEKDWSPWLRSL